MLRKIESNLAKVTGYLFSGTLFVLAISAFIWSIQLLLRLLGVM